jgi:hypothetical protein
MMTIILTAIYFLGAVLVLGGLFNDYMNLDLDKHFTGLAATAVLALMWPFFFVFATLYYSWKWVVKDAG